MQHDLVHQFWNLKIVRIRKDSLISVVLRILSTSIKIADLIGSRDKSHSPKDIYIYSLAFIIHFFLSSKKMHFKYKKINILDIFQHLVRSRTYSCTKIAQN